MLAGFVAGFVFAASVVGVGWVGEVVGVGGRKRREEEEEGVVLMFEKLSSLYNKIYG